MPYEAGRWYEERWERGGRRYGAEGRSGATAATADHCLIHFWNPDSVRSVWLVEYGYTRVTAPAAIDTLRFLRTSTEGTPANTNNPDIDSDFDREVDSPIQLGRGAFSVQPVIEGPELFSLTFPTTYNIQILTKTFPGRGIRVPPGTGLGLFTTTAVAARQADHYFIFVD